MSLIKYALVATSLFSSIFAQEPQAFPQITQGASSGDTCNGCYVVADVAAVVFGSEFITLTNTLNIGIQTGKNGSYTKTAVVVGQGQLSFNTQASLGGSTAGFIIDNNPTVTVGGAALTSPTAYQVFTAYSITSSFTDNNGNCHTVSGQPISPSVPFSTPIPTSQDPNYIEDAEASFIQFVGLTCSPGGQSVQSSTINPGTILTVTSTSVGPLQFTPQPVSVASPSTATFTPIGTISGNFSSYASISPYLGPSGNTAATFSTSFSQSTLPLMVMGALSILFAAWAL